MKYSVSNTINASISKIEDKVRDPEGMKEWMEGLQKVELISGSGVEIGTKRDLYFLHKRKEMKLTETIIEQNLPHQIKFAYQSPMGYNEVELKFEELSENNIKQTANNYFELKGAMKLMGFFFKGMFKKQTLKYLTAFKAYIER